MKHFIFLAPLLLVGPLACNESAPVAVGSEEVSAASQTATLAKNPFRAENHSVFNVGVFADPSKPSWIGQLTYEGGTYGIVFYSIGSGKPFAENVRGQAFHFEEIWEVYTWVNFDFDTQTLSTGDLVLKGTGTGLLSPNLEFSGSGVVTEAYGDMAMWLGRHQHSNGAATTLPDGTPLAAEGEFRLN